MKRLLLLMTLSFLLPVLHGEEILSESDRLTELEKQNKQLQIDIDDLKRNNEPEIKTKNSIAIQKNQWGKGVGFEVFGGMQGIYSRGGFGIITPRVGNFFSMTAGAVFSSGMLNQLFTDELQKYSTMMISGYITLKFSSPLLFNFIRVYGVGEFAPGFKFSAQVDLGKNIALGLTSLGGVEFYTMEWASFFIEAGGGNIFTIITDNNKYLQDEGWTGSGFALKVGGRFYIPSKNK